MSHVKAGGSSKNNRNNAGRRLGVKRFGGQTVRTGEVLVRQTGSTKLAGPGTFISRDFTIHAAIDGIVQEGDEMMKMYVNTPAVDAGLIAAGQAVEHYEIARYGTLASWAACLGMSEATALLEENLAEEAATDEALTELAEGSINDSAMESVA